MNANVAPCLLGEKLRTICKQKKCVFVLFPNLSELAF